MINPSPLTRRGFLRNTMGIMGAIALGGMGLAACARKEPMLRVASNVWPGYELLYLARERNYFDQQDIRMVEMPSATACIQALAAETIEGACLTLDEVLAARADGLDLRVVAILDISMGADAVLVSPEVQSLSELKGRRIGAEKTAVGAVMLDAMLQDAGLMPNDVYIQHMSVNEHREAFENGEVDALITFEPVVSQLAGSGAKRLFDSSQVPGRIVDVIAVRNPVLEQCPQALGELIAAHFTARNEFLNAPRAASPIMARRLGLPEADVPATFDGLELPDRQYNQSWLQGASPRIEETARELVAIMLRAKLLPRMVSVQNLADGRFVS